MTQDIHMEESGDVNITQESVSETIDAKSEYIRLSGFVNAIAKPLASRKIAKKLYKLIKNAKKAKCLKEGLGDVQKALRKNETGIVVLAGDVTPIDIYSHIPAICEDKDIQYCFTPSRSHLGNVCGRKRATIVVLVQSHEDYETDFNNMNNMLKELYNEEIVPML